jgi:hypothetical protein
MNFNCNFIIILLILLSYKIAAEPTFSVISIEGNAKVQHAQQYLMDKLAKGDKILDNDIIETYFQTKLVISFGDSSIIILGSNTKALLNFKEEIINNKPIIKVSMTVFNGGIFINIPLTCHAEIYTSNAVGTLNAGALSVVADGKSGETGMQVIRGQANIRNITQHKGKMFNTGLTTIILPNKEPTAPLYMTNRHATVLKHFFGDEFIAAELTQSGITPTEESGSTRLSFAKNLQIKKTKAPDEMIYKPLFNLQKIYGSILEDHWQKHRYYHSFKPAYLYDNSMFTLNLLASTSLKAKKSYPTYSLITAFHHKYFEASLRFSYIKTARHDLTMDFSSLNATTDKIEHLTIGSLKDSIYLYLGTLDNITLGEGLIVNRFTNQHPDNAYHTAGIKGQLRLPYLFNISMFVNDIFAPVIGGIHSSIEPSTYYFGAGFYFDLNQYQSVKSSEDYKFFHKNHINELSLLISPEPVYIYELDFGTELIMHNEFRARMMIEFAQKRNNGNDGFVTRLPTFIFYFNKSTAGISFIVESGRLLFSEFDPFYISQRSTIKFDSLTATDSIMTLNNQLSKKRITSGIYLFYKTNIYKGTDFSFTYKQNYKERSTFLRSYNNQDTIVNASPDFSFMGHLAFNDSLLKFIKYAGIYFEQYHGTYFPPKKNLLKSWHSRFGIEFQSKPIFNQISINGSYKLYYLDNPWRLNNFITAEDKVIDIYLGITWGFL